MDMGDPFQIIRRFWAAHNITHNPDDPRDWETLSLDVMERVMAVLDKRSLANVRLVCKTWHACVNRSVDKLQLCYWPSSSSFLATFTSLNSLTLMGPAIPHPQQRIDTLNPLLHHLALLPKLQQLAIAHTGPGSLDGIELLTKLTSLEVSRAVADNSSSSGAGFGPEEDLQQQHNAQEPMQGVVDWALPGAAAAAAAAAEEDQPAAAAAAAMEEYEDPPADPVQQHNMTPNGSSSSSNAGSSDGMGLPKGIVRLCQLESLVLESIAPDAAVLAQLKQLRRLELRGRTPRVRAGLMVATNPLPGLGCLTGLTSLSARCNYGISKLPADLAQLSGLVHLDVSKNMLWGIRAEMMQLSSLKHLDVSSNCLAALPEDISLLTSLTHLDVSNNSRVYIPAGLCKLSNLKNLQLAWVWSDLSVIWENCRGLSSLEVLNAMGNGIARLPEDIGGFKALTYLCLSMNNLANLPDNISRLTTLSSLELSDNRLSLLPAALCRLSGLASLGLRSNCLAGLPDNIGDLKSLTSLDASMNHISALPNSFTLLTHLGNLALSMNPLCRLPSGLSALKHLKSLEIYYVRLEGGPEGTESGLGQLQQLIPGLYIYSNTMFPHVAPDGNTGDAVAEPGQQQQVAVPAADRMEVEVDDVEQDDEDLLLLLSPAGSSRSAASSAASPNSVFSHVTAASNSSSMDTSSSYGLSAAAVVGMDASPGSESSSRAAAHGGWLSNLSLAEAAVAAALDTCPSPGDSDAVKSPGKDQQYREDQQQQQQQELMPANSDGSSSSRVSFAPEVPSSTAAAASSSGASSSSSGVAPMNWFQQPATIPAGAWSHLAAAAAAAAASGNNQPGHLQAAWSCDLSMIAAAAAAADASAAAASGATAGNDLDVVMPLRPLSKFHSVGRPLLSRYSRGGDCTGSPTTSSGYGLAASFRDDAPVPGAAAGSSYGADGAGSSMAAAAAAAAGDEGMSDRAARRQTMYDD